MFTTVLRRTVQRTTASTTTTLSTSLNSRLSATLVPKPTMCAPSIKAHSINTRQYSTIRQQHHRVKKSITTQHKKSSPLSAQQKRSFSTEQANATNKAPQDQNLVSEAASVSATEAAAQDSSQFTTMLAESAYNPAEHRMRLNDFMAGNWPREPNPAYWAKLLPPPIDKELTVFNMRFPGMRSKLEQLLEIDLVATTSAHLDAEGAGALGKMSEKTAKARKQLISELSFPEVNVMTGDGLTMVEHQIMFKKVLDESSIRTAATMKLKREEFYEESKKAGLYKNSFWNRLFNSKEDMIHARPSKSEWSGSEQAKTQPRSWMPLVTVAVLSSLGVLYLKYLDTQNVATATVVNYQTSGTLSIGGDFDGLVDQFGNEASSEQYRGFYPLYYFGFTKCPDICPTELHKMMAALDAIERDQPDLYRYIKPVFISVDPLRDTPEQIKAYAENFHPRMRWLTGSHEALTKAAKEFHIYFSIPDDATPDGDYNVDHSIFFFLMDREGKLLSYYGQNKNSQEIAVAMAAVVKDDLERDQYEKAVHGNKTM